MTEDLLAEQFAEHREHLRSVAYRMLGSASEADDAVQESWLRLSRTDVTTVENLGGWLTTVTARVCLNMLRARRTKREESLDAWAPDLVVEHPDADAPSDAAELADAVGLALLVVLETLSPAERLAFVLHDMFAVPFDEIAPIVDRTPEAARQLASRARRRVQGASVTRPDRARQREVVDAFFAAARGGDFDALVAVLDPDVVVRTTARSEPGLLAEAVRGAAAVAGQAITYSRTDAELRPALVNGAVGVVVVVAGEPFSVMRFTIVDDRIVAIDALTDPDRVRSVDLAALDAPPSPR